MDPGDGEFPRIRIMKRGEAVESGSSPRPADNPTPAGKAGVAVTSSTGPPQPEPVRRGVLRINPTDLSSSSADYSHMMPDIVRPPRSRSPPRFRSAFEGRHRPVRMVRHDMRFSQPLLAPTAGPFTPVRRMELARPARLSSPSLSLNLRPVPPRPSKSSTSLDNKPLPIFGGEFASQEIFKALEQAKPTSIPRAPIPELTDQQKTDPDALRQYYLTQLRMLVKDAQLLPDFAMNKPVKLIDSYFFWSLKKGPSLDHLVTAVDPRNANFSVVGVIGLQDTGKSYIMSQMIGPGQGHSANGPIFESRGNPNLPWGRFKTEGIDCFISRRQRTIFLDAQPVYSGSVLEEMIVGDRKPPAVSTEHVFVEHTVELQSIMFSAFLMSVCHRIVVVMKGGIDERVLRFLRTATILKLGPVHKDALSEGNLYDHWPELIFVNNLCKPEDLFPERVEIARQKISSLLKDYPLRYNGRSENVEEEEEKVFLIPDARNMSGDEYLKAEFICQLGRLKSRVAGKLPKDSVTPGVNMTEKAWFRYAKRCWAAVCKAPLVNTVAEELNVGSFLLAEDAVLCRLDFLDYPSGILFARFYWVFLTANNKNISPVDYIDWFFQQFLHDQTPHNCQQPKK